MVVAKKKATKKATPKKKAMTKAAPKKKVVKKAAPKKKVAKKVVKKAAPKKKVVKKAVKKAAPKKKATAKKVVKKATPKKKTAAKKATKKSGSKKSGKKSSTIGTGKAEQKGLPPVKNQGRSPPKRRASASRSLYVVPPSVTGGAPQLFLLKFSVRGTYPDGRVYSGVGTLRLSNDRHTRRAQYTVTFGTITYRGTALIRGNLVDKDLTVVFDYHERPYHKGMVVSIHEQDPKTGQLKGRLLYQGRLEVGEETITLSSN